MARHTPGAGLARGLCLAGVLCSVLALAQAAAAARSSKVVTVVPSTAVHMVGSDIYCTVLPVSKKPVVACFHDPGGPSSSVRKGYAIAAEESLVGVEPSGSTKPVVVKRQPSLAGVPVFAGGRAHKAIVQLDVSDIAAIGGTHMAVVVTVAAGGGNAIGIVYLDGKDNPNPGTDAIGISNHFVTISRIVSLKKATTVYRHAVY